MWRKMTLIAFARCRLKSRGHRGGRLSSRMHRPPLMQGSRVRGPLVQ